MDKNLHSEGLVQQDGSTVQRTHRLRALKKAHAAFNTEFSAVPCVVKNHNENGALLEFIDPVLVPERFVLHIEIDGNKIEVERRWQKGRQVGVQFVGEKQHTEIGRDQVVQPSENRLVSAQERAAELQRKIDEARHQGILLRAQLEQPAGEDGELKDTSSTTPMDSNPAPVQSEMGSSQSPHSLQPFVNADQSTSADKNTIPSGNRFMPAAPASYTKGTDPAVNSVEAAPPGKPIGSIDLQNVQGGQDIDAAPLTVRMPIQERRSGLDRRDAPRASFGRRPPDKKPTG